MLHLFIILFFLMKNCQPGCLKTYVLYDVFTPTRNAVEACMAQQGTHRYRKEHEHRYGTVVDTHTLDGANTISLKERKHGYEVLVKSTRMDGAITVVMISFF